MKLNLIIALILVLILLSASVLVFIFFEYKKIETLSNDITSFTEQTYYFKSKEFSFYKSEDSIFMSKTDEEAEFFLGFLNEDAKKYLFDGWTETTSEGERSILIPPEKCDYIGVSFNFNSEIPLSHINDKVEMTRILVDGKWHSLSTFNGITCFEDNPINFTYKTLY